MQARLDRYFYYLFAFTLTFGVVFTDVIGFSYTDELCALGLAILYTLRVLSRRSMPTNKGFIGILAVFAFYLIYSLKIKSNVTPAIIMDFVIQIKPFLAFTCAYSMAPTLTDRQKRRLKQLTLVFVFYMYGIGAIDFAKEGFMDHFFFIPAHYATCASMLALVYLYCDKGETHPATMLAVMACGMFSTRSKFFGFFTVCGLLMYYVRWNRRTGLKLSLKLIAFGLLATASVVIAAWAKIEKYFVTAATSGSVDTFARAWLYYNGYRILVTNVPFGTGLGSYATFASGKYYSPLYGQYGMDYIYGLSQDSPDFISDTHYPALAEFGIVGLILFFAFWISVGRKAVKGLTGAAHKDALVALLLVIFLVIECTAASTLTDSRGVFATMLLGMALGQTRRAAQAQPTPAPAPEVFFEEDTGEPT